MSTKINVRSPYFLRFTEPVQEYGIFICDTANLRNFSVDSNGVINNPNISKGTILDQSVYSFNANNGATSISRSVTYTIAIPSNYTNSGDSTIDCVQTFDQPSQVVSPSCPAFSGTVPNLSNIAPSLEQLIDVDSYFTQGTESIATYEVSRISGSGSVTAVISGTGSSTICKIQSSTPCVSAVFQFKAINISGDCTTVSNSFSFNTSGCVNFECDDADIDDTTGHIEKNGTVHKSTWGLGGLQLNKLLYGSTDITTSLNVGDNNTGSDRSIVLTYRFNIPIGYTNYPGTFDCDVTYLQPATESDPLFGCAEAGITDAFISDSGNIAAPKLALGNLISWTPQSFNEVLFDTPRIVTFTIEPPATNFSNSGGANIPCDVDLNQPAKQANCGAVTVFISQGYNSVEDICSERAAGRYWQTSNQVSTNASTPSSARYQLGTRMCYGNTPVFGGGKWYVITTTQTTGDAAYQFDAIQIDSFGIVQSSQIWNCNTGGGNI